MYTVLYKEIEIVFYILIWGIDIIEYVVLSWVNFILNLQNLVF